MSGGQNVAYVSSEDQRSYSYYRTRYGFAEGIDYNVKPGTNVYLNGLYSDFHDFGDTWVYTPNAGNMIKSVNRSQITFDNAQDCQTINQVADLAAQTDPTVQTNPCSPGSYNYRHYIRRPDQQVFSILAGARHDLSSTLIVYEFAGSRSHNIGGQDFPTTNFSGAAASYDANGNLVPGSAGADLALSLSKFVLMEVWNWFAVPLLHVSETSYWLMYRVSMLFGLMTGAGIRGSLAHLKALRLIRQLPPEDTRLRQLVYFRQRVVAEAPREYSDDVILRRWLPEFHRAVF